MKFYQNCRNLDELKAEYKRLAKMYHPDNTTDEEEAKKLDAIMAQVNAQYDELSQKLPKVNAQGEEYQPQERETPQAFRAAVLAVIRMQGVFIELCGSWLWITGDTKTHKEELKKAGYKFSGNKQAWYWHEEGYHKFGKKKYSLDEIRGMYGSRQVVAAKQEELPESA